MNGAAAWPIPLVVLLCAATGQILKLLAYSLLRRRLLVAALFRGRGLPSLPAAGAACLLTLAAVRHGWRSPEASFALVFAVLVVHDTVKLSGLAERQRVAVTALLERLDSDDPRPGPVAAFLDPRAHHPAHVAVGVVFGALFALALA